jgi:hypothetical protein
LVGCGIESSSAALVGGATLTALDRFLRHGAFARSHERDECSPVIRGEAACPLREQLAQALSAARHGAISSR